MQKTFDLIGLGIGPFHLSLAALMDKMKNKEFLFLDQKPSFQWHSELMFGDADMQTSYLKDLVTPVDPTSPYSYLNYLVQKGLFYTFMNTGRRVVTRIEFECYCQWVSSQLEKNLQFESQIQTVDFDKNHFVVKTNKETLLSKNLSIATGLSPRVPEHAKRLIGQEVFHAKSSFLKTVDLTNKRVLVIGGGQTGVEIFRNSVLGRWGRVKNIRLISRRQNLEPLDESPFTNEYFTPTYVDEFFKLEEALKEPIVKAQKLASDGNTPDYLMKLYNDLYQLRHVHHDTLDFKILPHRSLENLQKVHGGYKATLQNNFLHDKEYLEADVVILCTGFVSTTPKMLEPILPMISLDDQGRFIIKKNFNLEWKGPEENKIYALNFSRHRHGISEPQTSLMAWRSATIINDMMGEAIYHANNEVPSFVQYGKIE
jgi:lysine N6-hydroxylase